MTRVVQLGDGRIALPDNRWDLIDAAVGLPRVGVVIPYYEQPRQLSLVLAALAAQNYPLDRLDVVVADDGSAVPPVVRDHESVLSIRVVHQEDVGFRAAAARNLGARASSGSVLCFLDADTVPTPDYIRRAVALPSVAPDVVVVGRRKHADLSSIGSDAVIQWISDNAYMEESDETEPRWLVEGYERTENLLQPGWDGYKYVLSAVLTCSREMFDAAGGFDESFVQYGGEDWEFANRAFMMGAVLAYEPRAVAWHDGPDWAERAVQGRTDRKNAEALALAPLITDPRARTSGLRYRIPDCIALVSTAGQTAASLSVTLASLLGNGDIAVWLHGEHSKELYDALGLQDSRISTGYPDAAVRSRSRFVLDVSGRVIFSVDTVALLAGDLGPGGAGEVVIDFDEPDATVVMRPSRALHRSARWSTPTGIGEPELIDALFGRRRRHRSDVGLSVDTHEPWLSW
ncbi:glycosyltransferase [Rhodococcoides yunnanense]|uniref:glycosyltransferase n=1 Tax=Rhodococcoides yunnanense TaxID=278209 RepID=UPI0009324CD8|nr:glycosyltransferase [Rhodococcus yunnanensis]